MTWRLLVAVVAIRLAALGAGFIATVTIDNAVPEHQQQPETALRELPNRWDTGWYISIASRGYTYRGTGEIKDHNVAFFPAYPLAVGTVARVLRIPRTPAAWAWVGVLLSLLAFCGASIFLYRLAAPYGEDIATLTVTLVAAYPFALFFGAVSRNRSFFLVAPPRCGVPHNSAWPARSSGAPLPDWYVRTDSSSRYRCCSCS